MLQKITRLCWILAFIIFAVPAVLAKQSQAADGKPFVKPMAIYMGYEKFVLDDEFIDSTDAFIETSFFPVDIDRLPDYSAVLIGINKGKLLSPEENKALEAWVAAGGVLIFCPGEMQTLWNNKPPEWVGGQGAQMNWGAVPRLSSIREAQHPLLQGLAGLGEDAGPQGEKTAWKTEISLINFTSGKNLLGNERESILFENLYGKGKVIIIPPQFIPNQWPVYRDDTITLNMKPVEKQFLTNLVAYLNLPTRHEAIASWAKTLPRHDAVTVWYRIDKDEKPLGGMVHNPPYPLPKDELKELQFDMGIDERHRRDFFVTLQKDVPSLVVQPTDLVTGSGQKIAASHIRIAIQGKPRPNYPKASYWLVDPRYVEPVGQPGVLVKADSTYTYWIMLDTTDAVAGDYTGALRFQNGGELLRSVPIRLKVWPLHQPGSDVLHFEMEHDWFGMPGGSWIDPNENRPELLAKYQQALGQLQVDVGETWGDIELGYYKIHMRADDRLLVDAMAENPELFTKDSMPSLSFAGIYDVWWNNAITAGMSSFSQSWSLDHLSHVLASRITKNDSLPVGSPEHLRVVKWLWGEYHKYLLERGLRETYIKIGDEFGPEGIPDYIKSAAPMQAAGFKTYTTTYNLVSDKDSIARMDPYTDMWQVMWTGRNPREVFQNNGVPFDSQNEVWGTAASSYWGSSYNYGRGYGMLAAWLRMEGLHLHGYMRWHHNESEGALPGPDGPFDTAAVTNWGQSISEGRYLAQLYRLIDLAKQKGRGVAVAKQIEQEINAEIIGVPQEGRPKPLIPLAVTGEAVLGGVKVPIVCPYSATASACNAAKVRVFEMLMRLQKAMADVKPDVLFNGTALALNGKAVSLIIYGRDSKAAEALASRILQLSGEKPMMAAETDLNKKSSSKTLVLIGTLSSNATLAALIKNELATEITPSYPAAGNYAIRRLPATEGHPEIILVVGGDATGVEIGVRNMGLLLTTKNRW